MLRIDIVADIVCPWCFIGKRRLETAIAIVRKTYPEFQYETRWLPFFLNPDTPPAGEPYLPFLEQKFGGREPVEALFERVREAGRAYGLIYAFEKIRLRANTLQTHRLIYWALQFQRGENISDLASLVAIAAECGYPASETEPYLRSDDFSDIVREEERRVRLMGVRMVPTFILDQQHVIVGAEDPATLSDEIFSLIAQR